MYAEVVLVDHAGEGQSIEELHEEVVELLAVGVQTLSSEVVLFGHGAGLVVAPEEVNLLRVLYFDGQ
mgnify:CR=1 FL=1